MSSNFMDPIAQLVALQKKIHHTSHFTSEGSFQSWFF